jgi:Polyketide cyclase / dehydrase and lipid transport
MREIVSGTGCFSALPFVANRCTIPKVSAAANRQVRGIRSTAGHQREPLVVKPINFSCEETLDISPDEIAQKILDVANWPDFKGIAMLPEIKVAEFEVMTPDIVGSRIRVINTDGSTHVEEIVEWQTDRRLKMQFKEFSAPLARLATGFEETWNFERSDNATKVTRSFKLHAKSAIAWPVLWVISVFLKKAINRHLRQMRSDASS